jgi:hypothetical protein
MRENVCFVAAIGLVGISATYFVRNKVLPVLRLRGGLLIAGEVIAYSVMIPLVVIFLRPISQFIYFQF